MRDYTEINYSDIFSLVDWKYYLQISYITYRLCIELHDSEIFIIKNIYVNYLRKLMVPLQKNICIDF